MSPTANRLHKPLETGHAESAHKLPPSSKPQIRKGSLAARCEPTCWHSGLHESGLCDHPSAGGAERDVTPQLLSAVTQAATTDKPLSAADQVAQMRRGVNIVGYDPLWQD